MKKIVFRTRNMCLQLEQLEGRRVWAADASVVLGELHSETAEAESGSDDLYENHAEANEAAEHSGNQVGDSDGHLWFDGHDFREYQDDDLVPNQNIDAVFAADIDGDGVDEVVSQRQGELWVTRGPSGATSSSSWGRWSNAVRWDDMMVADINGDGLEDIVGRESGRWWAA
ncbi:MAG: VCBS repeat-containing protein, partial [Planctomycetales bacterium]|nr:VCBS repeat-containing protein [Planctomycetales bacterium]